MPEATQSIKTVPDLQNLKVLYHVFKRQLLVPIPCHMLVTHMPTPLEIHFHTVIRLGTG